MKFRKNNNAEHSVIITESVIELFMVFTISLRMKDCVGKNVRILLAESCHATWISQ